MTIQTILDRKGDTVFTIPPFATVKNAIDQMHEHGVAALVVKSGSSIIGVLSERDVVTAVSRFAEHALSMNVKSILTHTIITIAPGDSVKRAMRLMTHHRVRHLPVIEDGELVGIVSIGDVVKHRLEDLETESNVLRDVYIASR
jgi:CBS domain-containing protein